MSKAQSLYKTVSPMNNQVLHVHPMCSSAAIETKLQKAHLWHKNNRRRGDEGIKERLQILTKVNALLGQRLNEYAKLMTIEMGKPLGEAEAEIKKCMTFVDYFIKNTEAMIGDH